MEIKIQCGCGQRYKFDVEPVNSRLPGPVHCPVCGTEGTHAANQIIAQSAAAPVAPPRASAFHATPAVAPAPSPMLQYTSPARPAAASGNGEDADTWKWWYYILAGIGLGAYDVWRAYDRHSIRPLGGLFLSVVLVAIGVWDFNRKRKRKA